MRNLSVAAVIGMGVVVSSSASAAVVHAMLDDFSNPTGLGFTRNAGGGAGGSGGVGSLPDGGSFGWTNSAGFSVAAYSGIAFRVTGDLTGASLSLSLMGQDMNFYAIGEPINASVSGGWAYVSWASLEANWGTFATSEVPLTDLAIFVIGNSSPILIDDVMFAVPAPGAAALVGLAGLVTGRRRKA